MKNTHARIGIGIKILNKHELSLYAGNDGTFEGSMDLNISNRETLGFKVVLHTKEKKWIYASLKDSNPQGLNIRTLAQALPDVVPDKAQFDKVRGASGVALQDAVFFYVPKEELVYFSAKSAMYGEVAFASLKSSNGRPKWFSLKLKEIDLRHLPLVGESIAKFGKVVIDDLWVQVVTEEIKKEQLATILPKDKNIPVFLTDHDLKKGLGFGMKLQLGGKHYPMSLPPAPKNGTGNDRGILPDPATEGSETPVQQSQGPVHFSGFKLKYKDNKLHFDVNAALKLGGLQITLDGLSISSSITEFNPEFDLKGLGIAYRSESFSIGGAFLKNHVPGNPGYDEYSGMVQVQVKDVSVSAIGAYANLNGHPSLFIYATLNMPLGGPPFFFVNGLSLGYGYNRGLVMPTIDKVLEFPLVAEAMHPAAMPPNPGPETLTAELEKIHAYIPPAVGQQFLAIGISFSSFKLVQSTILLAATFGNRFELDLLGVSTLHVPKDASSPLAVVQLALKGALIPSDGYVGLVGQVTPASYIFSPNCHLTGGFAFCTWFSGEHAGDFVITVGGYHPHFSRPAHYPEVPRLGFSWQLDSNTRISGGVYFALCAHAFMAGGQLEIIFESGNLKAWFKASADFLISWEPYHYEASFYVDVGVDYTYYFWGTHHLTLDLGVNLDIWGPDFGGRASLDLGITSVSVAFGGSRPTKPGAITWVAFKNKFLPEIEKDFLSLKVGSGLVSKGPDENHLGIVNPRTLRLVIDCVIPVKQLMVDGKVQQVKWNTHWGVAPMGLANLDSELVIKITRGENSCQNLAYNFITQQVPLALWGPQFPAALNAERFIKNVLVGVEISVALSDLKRIEVSESVIAYEVKHLHNDVAMQLAQIHVEKGSKNIIKNSIEQGAFRDLIKSALKVTADIDLGTHITDVLLADPQLATLQATN